MVLRLGPDHSQAVAKATFDRIMRGYKRLIAVAKLANDNVAVAKFALKLAALQVKLGMSVTKNGGQGFKVVSAAAPSAKNLATLAAAETNLERTESTYLQNR